MTRAPCTLVDVIDEEFSAALAVYGEAYEAWSREHRARIASDLEEVEKIGVLAWVFEQDKSVRDRFLAACDSPRAPELLARIEELTKESHRVTGANGPTSGYVAALSEWVKSYPEIDGADIDWLVRSRMREHRSLTRSKHENGSEVLRERGWRRRASGVFRRRGWRGRGAP